MKTKYWDRFLWLFLTLMLILLGISLFAQPPTSKAWIKTFEDEFESASLDPAKWAFGFGWGINSTAFYEVNRPENVYCENGKLVIRVDTMPANAGWWSGAVNTRNLFSQKKGYFEVRMKIAKGNGFVNAFWGKPASDAWPPEIDFIEALGKNNARQAFFTVHYTPGHLSSGGDWTSPVSLADDFHVYGLEWSDKDFVWYVDGIERRRTTDGYAAITNFGEPFYLMLNVHVRCSSGGGCEAWTGIPDASNEWPAFMQVDWVRVWKENKILSTSISNFSNGDTLPAGSDLIINANADNGGNKIGKVDFYVNENLLSSDPEAPYTATMVTPSNGYYRIESKAYDSVGGANYSDPVFIMVGTPEAGNLLYNAEFNETNKNWKLDLTATAQAVWKQDQTFLLSGKNSAWIDIAQGTNSLFNIRLSQPVYLKEGKTYSVSFLSKAETSRKMSMEIKTNNGSYSYLYNIFNLTDKKQKYSTQFTCKQASFDASLVLSMGGNNSDIWLDSMMITEQNPQAVINKSYKKELRIFPNPCEDYLHIINENFVLKNHYYIIYDLSGTEQLIGKIHNEIIPVYSLRPGSYYLKIFSSERSETFLIIKV